MGESRLLQLPAELRNQIYRYVVVSDGPLEITKANIERGTLLFRICKQIRSETTNMFYSENSFRVTFGDVENYGDVTHWLRTGAGRENARCIIHITFIPPRCKALMEKRRWVTLKQIMATAAKATAASSKLGVPLDSIVIQKEQANPKKDTSLDIVYRKIRRSRFEKYYLISLAQSLDEVLSNKKVVVDGVEFWRVCSNE